MASAISLSSSDLLKVASQSGVAERDLPRSLEDLPDELILNIFGNLTAEELSAVACVSKRFRGLAGDRSLGIESELKFRFPLLKNIFNKQAWCQILKLETLEGVSFEGAAPFNPVFTSQALKDIHRLKVEGDAGYTVITMPQGLTINKLKSIIARSAAEGKFPSEAGQEAPGFRYFWPRISEVLGDVPVAKSYTFAISNSVVYASRYASYEFQRASVNAAGCELPQVLEAMTLLFLTYMASGEGKERLCSDAPWTYMRCLERIGNASLVVGGFASYGLHVCDDFDVDFRGAGVSRKFF